MDSFRDIPVLLISGAPESALRAYAVKYDAFLRKPFGLEEVIRVLRRILPA